MPEEESGETHNNNKSNSFNNRLKPDEKDASPGKSGSPRPILFKSIAKFGKKV
jgi:hypothetical protein